MAEQQDQPKPIEKRLKIVRTVPDDLQSYIVDSLVAQHQPDRFVLSFFEIWLPALVSESDEDRQQQFDALEDVEAKCVARLVVTPDKMREFVEILTTNLENYDKLMELRAQEDD